MPDKQQKPQVGQDSGDFERCYDEWSGKVHGYLSHLVGPGSTADDLFQETWMKAIEHRDQLRDPRRFGPWVLRIARNLAFNNARLRQRRTQIWALSSLAGRQGDDPDYSLLEKHPDEGPGPREKAIQIEQRKILGEVIAEFESDVQEMLQLRFYEDLTLAEVAEIVQQPMGTVCTKVYRALRQIKQRMKAQGLDFKGL